MLGNQSIIDLDICQTKKEERIKKWETYLTFLDRSWLDHPVPTRHAQAAFRKAVWQSDQYELLLPCGNWMVQPWPVPKCQICFPFFVSAGLGAKGLAALNLAIPGLRLFLMTYSCASWEMTAVRSCQWRLCWLAVFQIFCLIISLSFHCIWGCLAQSLRLACHRSSVWYLWRRIGWNEKIHFTWSESGFAQIWRKRRLLWECLLW